MRNLRWYTAIVLQMFSLSALAVNITVKGVAESPNIAIAKKEATFNARKNLLKEHRKIILAWTAKCYPEVNFNFAEVAGKISLTVSAVITREKIRRHKGIYTVTVYMEYATDSKTTTDKLLELFVRNMDPKDLKTIGYEKEKAWKTLYGIVKRW